MSSLDALVLDAELAPFDRAAIDLAILAARAGGKPVLVRPSSPNLAQILNALDCGADGVVVPHVRSRAEAEAKVRACQYSAGGRGFASSRSAVAYTTKGMARHRKNAEDICIIAQIEDA